MERKLGNIPELLELARKRSFEGGSHLAANEAYDLLVSVQDPKEGDDLWRQCGTNEDELSNLIWEPLKAELHRRVTLNLYVEARELLEEWDELILGDVAPSDEECDRLVARVYPSKQARERYSRIFDVEEFKEFVERTLVRGDRKEAEYLLLRVEADEFLEEEAPEAVAELKRFLGRFD